MPISERPWANYTEADYSDAGAFCDACLVNLNDGPRDEWTKAACRLPVREPGGALNRNGVHAAAARLRQVDAPPEARRRAARKLLAAYRELDEEAPDSVRQVAG